MTTFDIPLAGKYASDILGFPVEFADYDDSTTMILSDTRRLVRMNAAGANTYTIPPDEDLFVRDGSYVMIQQIGAGLTTLTAGSGVTINSLAGLVSSGQYAFFGAQKQSANTWIALGNLTSA